MITGLRGLKGFGVYRTKRIAGLGERGQGITELIFNRAKGIKGFWGL